MKHEYEIGVIGLGAMGRNLLLNIADHGFRAIGFDKNAQAVAKNEATFEATTNIKAFIDQLRVPRSILLLVPAGAPVDDVLNELTPLLTAGDLVIDAGNSHFTDTDRREKKFSEKNLQFFGMGVSGGELGARLGPSIMPGGNKKAYERVCPILEAVAAKAGGEPCVAYLGPASSGHYVKMVHNGIEYGLMQLISETYYLMKTVLNFSPDECHTIYQDWNRSELNSYLLEITAQIFLKKDERTKNRLIDVVRDVARQKGTGMWTCQDAMKLQIPVPTIDAAVALRDLSTFDEDRKKANATLGGPQVLGSTDRHTFLERLRCAYYASSVITFAQGMALLQKASTTYRYDLNLETVARIWRGGCIIRAAVLEPIMSAFHKDAKLSNLLLDAHLGSEVTRRQNDLRVIVQEAARLGLPAPALMSSLAYYDAYRSRWLPTNLIQAQRDDFGAHSYERIDATGSFHSDWGTP